VVYSLVHISNNYHAAHTSLINKARWVCIKAPRPRNLYYKKTAFIC